MYQLSCSQAAGDTIYGELLVGDGTIEWVWENAEPGDLIFYSGPASIPAKDCIRWSKGREGFKANSWSHCELYIGQYTCTDGTVWEHANASSNANAIGKNVDIHNFTVTGSNRAVYVVHLKDWLEKMAKDYTYNKDFAEVDPSIAFIDSDDSYTESGDEG